MKEQRKKKKWKKTNELNLSDHFGKADNYVFETYSKSRERKKNEGKIPAPTK